MAVSEDDVRHIATLARLGLEPGRIALLARELNAILAHMDTIAAASADDIADPAAAASASAAPVAFLPTPLRSDGRMPHQSIDAPEAFAPSMRDGFFLVPRLGTHDEEGDAG